MQFNILKSFGSRIVAKINTSTEYKIANLSQIQDLDFILEVLRFKTLLFLSIS